MERDSFQFTSGKNIYMILDLWATLSPRLARGEPEPLRVQHRTKKQNDKGKREASDASKRR
jgi:hypothetical protein